jgi:imidazoleglycerol-phosphate dehydratase/histidinol-phosphatase
MKKALFIDRDGTIIAEPADEQIDSLEKLAFVPGAISALKALTGLGFDLVLATNQDGLGTPSFPEDTFWPAHNKMLATLGGEGVAFDDQLIDRTFEADAAPTRKPRTGMFGRYTGGEYDLAASYVIGDRATDILLARNLGARGILLAPPAEGLRTLEEAGAADACALVTDSWSEIAEFIRRGERRAEIRRETRETQITVPTTEYSAPRRECCADEGCEEDPCERFSREEFPMRSFFPNTGDCRGKNDGCCCR